MEWIEASVTTTTGAADALSELLMRHGAKGTQILDRLDVPQANDWTGYGEIYGADMKEGLPPEVTVKAWFASPEDVAQAKATVKTLKQMAGFDPGTLVITETRVQEEDWAENWKQYYKPMRVGQRLVIKPVWENYEPRAEDLVIDMDPGMAFGTGNHETTRLCLQMIEQHYTGGRALDIGTGSGILAIALAKLGAADVTAVDLDPVAVSAARQNVARNGLKEQIAVLQGDLAQDVEGPYAFVSANILADVVIRLAEPLKPLLKEGAHIVVSGIIKERRQDVIDAYLQAGYRSLRSAEEGEWVALLFGFSHG